MAKRLLFIVCLLFSVNDISSQTLEQSASELPVVGLLGAVGIFASVPSATLSVGIQRLRSDIRECENERSKLCEKALARKRSELAAAEADLEECESDYGNFFEFLDKLCEVYKFKECPCSPKNSEEECNSTGYCEWDCESCD